jgi:hypothetical protein
MTMKKSLVGARLDVIRAAFPLRTFPLRTFPLRTFQRDTFLRNSR